MYSFFRVASGYSANRCIRNTSLSDETGTSTRLSDLMIPPIETEDHPPYLIFHDPSHVRSLIQICRGLGRELTRLEVYDNQEIRFRSFLNFRLKSRVELYLWAGKIVESVPDLSPTISTQTKQPKSLPSNHPWRNLVILVCFAMALGAHIDDEIKDHMRFCLKYWDDTLQRTQITRALHEHTNGVPTV